MQKLFTIYVAVAQMVWSMGYSKLEKCKIRLVKIRDWKLDWNLGNELDVTATLSID